PPGGRRRGHVAPRRQTFASLAAHGPSHSAIEDVAVPCSLAALAARFAIRSVPVPCLARARPSPATGPDVGAASLVVEGLCALGGQRYAAGMPSAAGGYVPAFESSFAYMRWAKEQAERPPAFNLAASGVAPPPPEVLPLGGLEMDLAHRSADMPREA